jgi:lipoprotein-anchoring transpeptidase ErfK/SrfK
VPDIIAKWVNSKLPNDRIAQSKTKRLSYRSVAELMAERYHTDVDFLIDTNGAQKVYSLKAGSELIVPNVSPFEIEKIAGIQHPRDEVKAQRHVVVDTKRNQVRIFEAAPVALVISEDPAEAAAPPKPVANRSLIASFPITPGKPQFIHRGMWEMRTCVEFPSWRYDKLLLETGKRSKDKSRVYDLPSGPNSPVGVIWCGLSKSGIGLHGTADPETIGRAQSAGCIRLANWDAIRLPTLVSPGSSVEIR